MTTTYSIDSQKADLFAEKMLDVINYGSLALMTSIGHRTGLFDAMATLPASTSQQIAASTQLNERYVREWLGAMVTGGFIEYNPQPNTYFLPAEHAAFLTRSAASDNIAVVAQYIPLLATVEDKIIDCFYHGGGVPYSEYKRFHKIMAEESSQTVVNALMDTILPLVPGITEKLLSGIQVLDVGCGSGYALITLAIAFPQSQFVGYDFSEEAITTATKAVKQFGLTNIRFEVKDAATINEVDYYDLILTFDAIHDQAKPDIVLAAIARALKPEGIYLMQDIRASSSVHRNLDHPISPMLYTISCLHCMSVSLAENGAGLGAMWGEEKAVEMLYEAGFNQVEVKQLDHDIQNNYYINRK
ncbi:MAG: methyltransferase domain-containing protein [Microcoleaceae cyanobacterium]